MLQFCVSQQTNDIPFTFRATGIRVFSFEEAMYHIYHYWRESVDDFLSSEMITWVSGLGLSFIAAGMKEIAKGGGQFAAQVFQFFRLSEYFNETELDNLAAALKAWEARMEWEKLKERADYLVERGEPARAIPLYKRALKQEENCLLQNNIGIAHMRLQSYNDAIRHLARAFQLSPNSVAIALHYIEAAILAQEYELAHELLEKAIEIRNLTFTYREQTQGKALDGIDLDIDGGAILEGIKGTFPPLILDRCKRMRIIASSFANSAGLQRGERVEVEPIYPNGNPYKIDRQRAKNMEHENNIV